MHGETVTTKCHAFVRTRKIKSNPFLVTYWKQAKCSFTERSLNDCSLSNCNSMSYKENTLLGNETYVHHNDLGNAYKPKWKICRLNGKLCKIESCKVGNKKCDVAGLSIVIDMSITSLKQRVDVVVMLETWIWEVPVLSLDLVWLKSFVILCSNSRKMQGLNRY